MLEKARTLKGYQIKAVDGAVGRVTDLYFDDQFWIVRYLVADTGGWLTGRKVLLSPYAVNEVLVEGKELVTVLTRKQIEESPGLESDQPVSKQFEETYFQYYGWPVYWGGPYTWGAYSAISRDPEYWTAPVPGKSGWDPHLRSIAAVTGYQVMAPDGGIGHVGDFIIDDESWAIRYLVIETHHWWPGKKVLVSADWIDQVSWEDSTVFTRITRDAIKQAPDYEDEGLLDREYETRLFAHHDRPGYWRTIRTIRTIMDPPR